MGFWSLANGVRRTVLAAAIFVFLAACGHVNLPSYGVVTRFELTDETGKAFDSKTLDGSIWIADFIFTNCAGPCPRMSSEMHKLQTSLAAAQSIRFVSFTVDPDRDTPPVLADYAKRFHAEPGRWIFLTGTKPALHHITRDVFMLGDVTGALDHSTRFALVDKQGRIRGFYVSTDPEQMTRLLADTKALAQS